MSDGAGIGRRGGASPSMFSIVYGMELSGNQRSEMTVLGTKRLAELIFIDDQRIDCHVQDRSMRLFA